MANPWTAAGAVTTLTPTRLRLLSGFDLTCEDEQVAVPDSCARLIAFLAIHRRRLSRSFVAGRLWSDGTDERAGANLRSTLWRVRSLGAPIVDSDRTSVWLRDDVSVDVTALTEHCELLIDGADPTALDGALATALGFELLPDWYEDWVFFERERLRQLCLHALEQLGHAQLAANAFGAAIDSALRAIQFEPLRESPWRLLVRAHIGEGNRSEALRQAEDYRRLLHDEMRLTPTDTMLALTADLTT